MLVVCDSISRRYRSGGALPYSSYASFSDRTRSSATVLVATLSVSFSCDVLFSSVLVRASSSLIFSRRADVDVHPRAIIYLGRQHKI